MNEHNVKLCVTIATSTVVVGFATKSILNIISEGRKERLAIHSNMLLDVQAIHKAAAVLNERIERGEFRNVAELREGVQNEIEFQKIIIREI